MDHDAARLLRWTFLAALLLTGARPDARAQPSPTPAPLLEGHAPSDGVALRYRVFGTASPDTALPLLVLNGGPGLTSEHFGPLADRLSRVAGPRMTVTFDQRGTGGSTLSEVDASTVHLAAMIADVEALRVHLGIEAWVVFGHSWGGMYAMAYAVAHPARVRGLLLSASGGSDLAWTAYFQDNLRHRLGPERRAAYAAATTQRERVEAMAAAYVYDPANIPAVVEALSRPGASNAAVRSLVFQDLVRLDFDLRDDLARFEAPTLLLHGRQDVLGEAVALRTHAALPNARLAWFDACGHYLWLDQPEAYFAEIGAFLSALGSEG